MLTFQVTDLSNSSHKILLTTWNKVYPGDSKFQNAPQSTFYHFRFRLINPHTWCDTFQLVDYQISTNHL